MDELPKDPMTILGMGVSGLVMGALWLRSKLSRDRVQIASDHAEVGMLETYRKENVELRASLSEVTADRNGLYKDIGEMSGSIRALEGRQKMLEETIDMLRQELAAFRNGQGGANG